KWDPSFDVKHSKLNEQHVKLFDLIRALDEDRSNTEKLKALLDFVVVHFTTEEELFEKFNYKFAKPHKDEHDKFVMDAKALKKVGDDEIKFIKNWLVNHIKGNDMKYSNVLKE